MGALLGEKERAEYADIQGELCVLEWLVDALKRVIIIYYNT
jgi:hypothetical protein